MKRKLLVGILCLANLLTIFYCFKLLDDNKTVTELSMKLEDLRCEKMAYEDKLLAYDTTISTMEKEFNVLNSKNATALLRKALVNHQINSLKDQPKGYHPFSRPEEEDAIVKQAIDNAKMKSLDNVRNSINYQVEYENLNETLDFIDIDSRSNEIGFYDEHTILINRTTVLRYAMFYQDKNSSTINLKKKDNNWVLRYENTKVPNRGLEFFKLEGNLYYRLYQCLNGHIYGQWREFDDPMRETYQTVIDQSLTYAKAFENRAFDLSNKKIPTDILNEVSDTLANYPNLTLGADSYEDLEAGVSYKFYVKAIEQSDNLITIDMNVYAREEAGIFYTQHTKGQLIIDTENKTIEGSVIQ